MNQRSLSLVLIGASVAAPLAACTPEVPTTTIAWTERRAQLGNGMKVVLLPDTSTQLVEVDVRYEVGANEDPAGKAGLAHLVEHMMFQHRPLGPDKPPTFEIIPQLTTFFNAYTIWDKTHYQNTVPKEDLETMLKLEAFRMNAGCDTIPSDQFEREREVVRNEIRQRGGTPEGLIPDILAKALYPEGHPYSHTVGGDDAQLSNIVFQDTCNFMAKYYVPERATLVISGNIDEAVASKLIGAYFAGIKPRPAAPRSEVKPIELRGTTIDKELDIERPQLVVAWKLPSVTDEDWDKVNALSNGVGKMAQLAREYDDCIRDAGGSIYGGSLAPTFVVGLELCNNDHFDEALAWVWRGAAGGSWGLKNAEFDDDTKALVKQNFIEGLESLGARTEWMAEYIQFQGKHYKIDQPRQFLFDELDRIDRLNADGWAEFAKKTFQKDKAVVIRIKASDKGLKGDKRSGLTFSAKTHDKAIEPLVDPAEANRALPAPKGTSILTSAERYTLDNGMKIVLLPTDSPLPIVRTRLIFRAGAAHEATRKAGLADMAASMLAPESDADFMKTGVYVDGGANDDVTVFESGGLAMYTDVIVEALERVLKIGTYDQQRLEKAQQRLRQRLDSQQAREGIAFQTALNAAVFGPNHPYTTNGLATTATAGELNYDAVTSFKRAHYEAKNATLIVVGAFDVKKVKSLISDTFGEWNGGDADTAIGPQRVMASAPVYLGVATAKEGPQADIQIAYPAPALAGAGGTDPLAPARAVMVEMLNLRLGRIRTELGSTYGTYAHPTRNVGPNAYLMGGGVDGARGGESLKAMRDKIDSLRRGDDFDRDFVAARRAVLKKILGVSSEPQELAARLGQIEQFGLQADYYDQLTRGVATLAPAAVKQVIAEELKPETEVIVVKADKATLDKTFGDAGLKYESVPVK